MKNDKYLEVSVVAQRLGVSPSTVYRLIQGKKLKSVRCGVETGIRVVSSSVEEFKNKRSNY